MNYQEFKEQLVTKVTQQLEEKGLNVDVLLGSIPKVNFPGGREALLIRQRDSSTTKTSPTIYLDYLWEKYDGNVDDATVEAVDVFTSVNRNPCINAKDVLDFEKMRSKLRVKLVNAECNREFLNNYVNVPVLDLAAVFYCDVSDIVGYGGSELLTVNVSNEMLHDVWKKGVDDLILAVKENVENGEDEAKVMRLCDMVTELMGENMPWITDDTVVNNMYVISNKEGTDGAICMLYPGVLDSLVDKLNADLAVLPSSKHECIAMALLDDSHNREELRSSLGALVYSVNRTDLAKSDFLSDTVYFYGRENRKLEIM